MESLGTGLTPVTLGEVYGQQSVTLNVSNIPPHAHFPLPTPVTVAIPVSSTDDADIENPVGAYLHNTGADLTYAGTANALMGVVNANVTVQNAGANQPVNTIQQLLWD
ncbi:hypothetical protein [Flavobacterium sp. 3HN19-14]|uniref:hypothetical protein n=1 Tax=Flavobacterium sp. 3HN19-14 TaxID=3448133 RepID=UPI003EE27225